MFRLVTKNIINNANRVLINNNSNNIKSGIIGFSNFSTSSNATTVAEPKIIERTPGVAAPNKRATPPKVPKRRPDKIRSIKYDQYSDIPRMAAKGFFRITNEGFDYYFLDVRSSDNFANESIVGAVNHPLEHIEESMKELRDKSSLIMIMGEKERGWPQACEAALKLKNNGFVNVIVVEAGIQELVEKGFFYTSEKDFI
ncbi:hypothetical protein RB653_000849 [Dictyostelium firmibasis]|uniref:Rhodanese domain-containing protein n=1 Tax=Dictyostelium firmibasis TaxID=79012 RepID=A0AAN7U3E8_9MYCE